MFIDLFIADIRDQLGLKHSIIDKMPQLITKFFPILHRNIHIRTPLLQISHIIFDKIKVILEFPQHHFQLFQNPIRMVHSFIQLSNLTFDFKIIKGRVIFHGLKILLDLLREDSQVERRGIW